MEWHLSARATRRSMVKFGVAATAAGTVGTLAACGASNEQAAPKTELSKAPVTLTYTNWFAPASAQEILFEHQTQLFKEKYPQITVEQAKRAPGTSMLEQFLSMAAAGTTPDLAALNPQFVEPLRARGSLADLTPYVKRDAKTYKPEDFFEATRLRAVRDGKWHAIPLQMGLWILIYNRSLFQQVGVGDPDKSWTWDTLLEVTRKVKNQNENVVGIDDPPYELPVRDNGGEILSKDEKTCLLGEPAAYEAIQWIADLRLKHRVWPMPDEVKGQNARKLFASGRYVYHIGDPGFLSNVQHDKPGFSWDIYLPPKGKKDRVTTVKGPSLVIAQDSKHKDAAWAWLGDYTGIEMQRFVALEGKIVSARKSALEAFVAVDEGFNKKMLLEIAAIAKPMPYVAQYDEMSDEIQTGLNAVYNGEQSARTAMPEVARKVNLLLKSS